MSIVFCYYAHLILLNFVNIHIFKLICLYTDWCSFLILNILLSNAEKNFGLSISTTFINLPPYTRYAYNNKCAGG